MANLLDAVRLLWCPGLQKITRKPTRSLHEWLSTANYAPSVAGDTLVLSGFDMSEFFSALGFDINRISTAGSETLRNVAEIPSVPKSLGWPYVKLYYSSLFYCHSLLRIWGRIPTYLKTSDLLYLRKTLNAYQVQSPFALRTGQFIVAVDIPHAQVTVREDKGGGGSHEAVWREFSKALEELKTLVSLSQFLSTDKNSIITQIDQAISLITCGGSNRAWLSTMRNDINYRQGEGVWYPYAGRARTADISNDISKIFAESVDINTLLGTTGSDLLRFRSSCLFVIALARQSLADLSQVGGAKIFLNFGQARFEAAYPLV